MAALLTPTAGRRRGRPRLPGALRWASRIQAWPPALWLALQAAALWPAAWWVAGQLAYGPAQAPGLMALGALLMAAASGRLACHWPARTPWLLAAATLTLLAAPLAAPLTDLPPAPDAAALSALAMGCAWAAFRRPGAWAGPAWFTRWRVWLVQDWAAHHGADNPARRSGRHIEQAMRQLQRAAAWKCAYAALLIGCGLAPALRLLSG